jgi:thiol-disulfide isomerase/thioredoxin
MLQADDSELWQRIFCEPCREIIILFAAVVSKFKPPQILETALLP